MYTTSSLLYGGTEMKLAKSGSVFNMGDTSVRVQEVVEVNRLILKVLSGDRKSVV